MTTAKLAFGLEMEMLLKPKSKAMKQALQRIYAAWNLADIASTSSDWATGFAIVRNRELSAQNDENGMTVAEKQTAKANADKYRAAFRYVCANMLTAQYNVPSTHSQGDYVRWLISDEPTLDEVREYCKSTPFQNFQTKSC